MTTIDKINEFFSYLIDEKTFSKRGISCKAQYWKMGTDPLKTFDEFYKKVDDKNIQYIDFIIFSKNENQRTIEGDNATYFFNFKNVNLSPTRMKNGNISIAAMTQYIRGFQAFNIATLDRKYKNLKTTIEENGKLIFSSNFKSLISKENRLNLIIEMIANSLYSNMQAQRDFAYSSLFEILNIYNFDYSLIKEEYRCFELKKANVKSSKRILDLKNGLEHIKNNVFVKGTKNTYQSIINEIKNVFNSLEEFINVLWEKYQEKSDEKYDEISRQINIQNLSNTLKSKRLEFKNKIFNNRKDKDLIHSKDELYSDLIVINGSQENILTKFNEAEAAHIYEYKKIKRNVLFNENESELEYVNDPDNGLIMATEYHKSFDRNQWFFNINGEMIIPEENKKYLLENRGLKLIKINPKVLNDRMKFFLTKR